MNLGPDWKEQELQGLVLSTVGDKRDNVRKWITSKFVLRNSEDKQGATPWIH